VPPLNTAVLGIKISLNFGKAMQTLADGVAVNLEIDDNRYKDFEYSQFEMFFRNQVGMSSRQLQTLMKL
jgi:hypothetical protein